MQIIELNDIAVLHARGPEAADFLQNQFSNDVHAAGELQCQLHAYCNPKGRALALLRLIRHSDGFYLLLPRDLADAITRRLQMFVLRAQVEIARADCAVFGLMDCDAAVDARVHAEELARAEVDAGRRLLIGKRAALDEFARAHAVLPARASDAWRSADILAGLPQIYAATTEQWIPQMLNLDLTAGLSFTKGCYPGQEIVARLRYRGTVKQRMLIARARVTTPPQPGDAVYADAAAEQSIGRVVDAAIHTAPDAAVDAVEYTVSAVAPSKFVADGDVFIANAARLTRLALPYAADLRAAITE